MVDQVPAVPTSGPLPADPVKVSKAEALNNVVNMLHDVAEQAADSQDHGALIDIMRALQSKPGVRTTEFALALLGNAAGGLMQFWPGHEVIGGAIIIAANSFYMLSRTVVKAAEAKGQAQAQGGMSVTMPVAGTK